MGCQDPPVCRVRGVSSGHTFRLQSWWSEHCWSRCSTVIGCMPQGHTSVFPMCSFPNMCALSLLWSVFYNLFIIFWQDPTWRTTSIQKNSTLPNINHKSNPKSNPNPNPNPIRSRYRVRGRVRVRVRVRVMVRVRIVYVWSVLYVPLTRLELEGGEGGA